MMHLRQPLQLPKGRPHLRIVSDHLWYKANEVVDKRRVFQQPIRGAEHPLRGTTRQRRGLLAGVFTCGVCGGGERRRNAVVAHVAAGELAAMLQRTLMVNAFAEPQLVKHACVIVQRRLEGKTCHRLEAGDHKGGGKRRRAS